MSDLLVHPIAAPAAPADDEYDDAMVWDVDADQESRNLNVLPSLVDRTLSGLEAVCVQRIRRHGTGCQEGGKCWPLDDGWRSALKLGS